MTAGDARPDDRPDPRFRWAVPPPGRLIARGHVAGDFLEAHDWRVLEERHGFLRLDVGLPEQVRNPRGQLFGGFTSTYVDLVALFTVRAGTERPGGPPRRWLATTHMSLDYFEPITGPRFVIESQVEKRRGRTSFVVTRFVQDGVLAVVATTTIREARLEGQQGDA